MQDADRVVRAGRTGSAVLAVVERLRDATNRHDVGALAGCFAQNYVNETPAHPQRGFVGKDQVDRNWRQIFEAVPDVTSTIVASCVDGDQCWSEWEMVGRRRDGAMHLMRGVIVFTVDNDLIRSARFFLEPVHDDGDIESTVSRTVSGTS